MSVPVDRVTAARFRSQLLTGPRPSEPLAVVERLLAVQAQDPRGARLTFRARSRGFGADAVDRALTEDRTLVVSWLNRGTLHLVRREDYGWLHQLTAPPMVKVNEGRLAQEDVSPSAAERGVVVIERALASHGPLTRAQLREHLDRAGVPTDGQALVHVLLFASLKGRIVRGPVVGRHQAFVLVRDWLGHPEPMDRDVALAELARRYLAGHGPADHRDLAVAKLPLRDTRAALSMISAQLHERPDGLVELKGRRAAAAVPPPLLLGAFDPLLLGWCSRAAIIGSHPNIVTTNGVFRPFALVDGRAAATWTLSGGTLRLAPFAALDAATSDALAREESAVLRYLGPSAGRTMG